MSNDDDIVSRILASVLPVMEYNSSVNQEPEVVYVPLYIETPIKGFNPETDIIVKKSQLDITKELKAIAGMANKIKILDDISKKVTEVHARLNNKVEIVKKEKPLTAEQREFLEIETGRKNAHDKIRLNGYKL